MEPLLRTATVLRSIGQWYSFNALPHCWGAVGSGAVGSGSPALYYHNAREQWAVVVLHCTATLLQADHKWG